MAIGMRLAQRTPEIHKGLSTIINHYDGLLVDLWGVIHNGVRIYEGVIDCLKKLKDCHKQVIFLSNAPRRKSIIQLHLEELGIPKKLYHDIFTSGEDTYLHLRNRTDPWYASLGSKCFHLGLEDKIKNLCPDLKFQYVEHIEDADFILNTGLDLEEDSFLPFDSGFIAAIKKGVPMICANPDEIVMHSNKVVFPAGYLAKRYEYLGGRVRYHGKPYPSIYAQATKLFNNNPTTLLAIGDSLTTDIKGANQAKIDSVLIAGGIHSEELNFEHQSSFLKVWKKYNINPVYVLPMFKWL
ncbi:MAG: TIGR01459 family HAD-type hydrolase [Alphaproteobacteria bacterium]|nr:TIGR01459 family HAD-type hydrolase [Alphaproteobacteria bacterium]